METQSTSEASPTKLEVPTTKIDSKELQKNPELARDAMYVLLTIKSWDPKEIETDLQAFIADRKTGQNKDKWDQRIREVRKEHEDKFNKWHEDQLDQQKLTLKDLETEEQPALKEEEMYCVHCTDYLPLDEEGKLGIKTTFSGSEGRYARTTVHTSLNHVVRPVAAMGGSSSWEGKKYVVVSKLDDVRKLNGNPYGGLPQDLWWELGTKDKLTLPEGTIVIVKKGDENIEGLKKSGAKVIETETSPYDKAEEAMRRESIKVVDPNNIVREFKGFERIFDNWGTMIGFHLGESKREGSESYLRAEAKVFGSAWDSVAFEEVDRFNNQDYPGSEQERLEILFNLIRHGYFGEPGFQGITVKTPEDNYSQESLNRAQSGKSDFPDEVELYNSLSKLAKDQEFKLSYYSEGFLEKRLKDIEDNLDIIPPNLVAGFLIHELPRLTPQAKS